MWVGIRLPETGTQPLGHPHCPYCRSTQTRVYERITKKVKHPNLSFVSVVRRRCENCGRTFRHYAPGVNRSIQTATVKGMNVLLYSIGFSYSQIVETLRNLGVRLVKSTVWRSVRSVSKKAYYLHKQSLKGKISVMGMPADLFRAEGPDILVHFVAELLEGKELELEFPDGEEGNLYAAAITTIAKKIGAEFVIKGEGSGPKDPANSNDTREDTYMSRLKRGVKRRYRELTQEANLLIRGADSKDKRRLRELLVDCDTILDIVEGKENGCEKEFWEIYKRYAWAKAPHKGETATLWYKMRLFTLRLWDESNRILKQLESTGKVQKREG